VFVIFVAGAADRIYVSFGISYETLVWVFRVLALSSCRPSSSS